MDLNEGIKKQETIVEELNVDINNLIVEYGWSSLGKDVLALVTGGPMGLIRSKASQAGIDNLKKKEKALKEKKKKEEEDGGKKSKHEKELNDIKDTIARLSKSLETKIGNSSKYKSIVFRLDKETTLTLPKYGSKQIGDPGYEHTLMGDRNLTYNVLEVNEEDGFMIIREKNMSKNFRLELKFKTLETGKKQENYVRLLYNQGKSNLMGHRKKIKFEIISIK